MYELECPYCGALNIIDGYAQYEEKECHNCGKVSELVDNSLIPVDDE